MPAFLDRPLPLDDTLAHAPLPAEAGEIVDVAPIDDAPASRWLLLGRDGRLWRFDADRREYSRVRAPALAHEAALAHAQRAPRPRLHASPCGRYAAVVHDFGTRGHLLELETGRTTLPLDGGDYHPDQVPFSFAFARHQGRVVVVHRTDWNRLDVSDAATGASLTRRRVPTEAQAAADGTNAGRVLDYFHGCLRISPDGERILDDGWAWHPMGMPCAWSLARWLDGHVWESDTGDSRVVLARRPYFWSCGAAWLDARRVAIEGLDPDPDDPEAGVHEVGAGAQVFDLDALARSPLGQDARGASRTGAPSGAGIKGAATAFAGPAGEFFGDGGLLYAAHPERGLERWDPADGARTGALPGFVPQRHHRGAGELVQLVAGRRLVRWKLPGA